MRENRFKVSRRWAGTPYDLVREPHQMTLLKAFHQPLTPFIKAIGYGLFALTDDNPDQFQEVAARELLEVIEVAKHPTGFGSMVFHGQHYRDAFEALEALFNLALPIKTKRIRKEGRRLFKEYRIDFVRMLDGFGLVYLNPKTGKPLSIDDDANFEPYRVDISGRYEKTAGINPRRRRKKGRKHNKDGRPVWGLVKIDPNTGEWLRDNEGQPLLRIPDRYRFRWSREIQADLLGTAEGRGWLNMSKAVFRVLLNLRYANRGRGHPTAIRLFDLILSDILGKGPTRQILEKPAKLIFVALGFPEPGSIKKPHLHNKDGRWSRNVEMVAKAVMALKAEGVLLPESDETPYEDPNPERRKAPYYRWKRAAEWTFTTSIEIMDQFEGKAMQRTAIPVIESPAGSGAAFKPPKTMESFSNVERPVHRGRNIRASRIAAGMTMRGFVKRFGKSIGFWSMVENETLSKRTGKPRSVPPEIQGQIEAFVIEHLNGVMQISLVHDLLHANGSLATR